VLANGVVMLAAGGVALAGSAWPGIVTGLGIAPRFGASAIEVNRTVGDGDTSCQAVRAEALTGGRAGNFPGVQIRLLSKRLSVRSTQDRWTGQEG
jgi:hypothetical protein